MIRSIRGGSPAGNVQYLLLVWRRRMEREIARGEKHSDSNHENNEKSGKMFYAPHLLDWIIYSWERRFC